ncbi:unnamed protein product [Pseudo-nitzschia multistriata]|uniref:SET domain-containing protein n=1 Tax=Pseudo-nitzschia multistriata TaxID=183589 RepID=A0A448YYT1_9STRA|nr:unnamed protein product [Pseudo-nitzschia multistriata]
MDRRAQIEFGRQDRSVSRMGGGQNLRQQQRLAQGSASKKQSAKSIPRDCATSHYKRLIHDALTWRFLQDTYIETVDNRGYSVRRDDLPSYSGFAVQVEIRDDGHRGRSVYAAEPIKKGTKVWKSTHLVSFSTPFELQSFLGELDHDLQCDALLWAYVEKGEGYVSLALDPASFVNHGETEEDINLDGDCYALRDIRMGEELLENYTHFIGFGEEEGVEWYNHIRGLAWQEGDLGSRTAESTNEYNLLGAPKMGIGGVVDAAGEYAPGRNPAAWMAGLLLLVLVLRRAGSLPFFSGKKEKEGL